MPKSVLRPLDNQYYEYYRRGLIERHIASNGRFLQSIWLVEKASQYEQNVPRGFLDTVARHSEEQYLNSDQIYEYQAYPALVSTKKVPEKYLLPGGGDNPLLYGGLAMATLCMEVLKGVSAHSFDYARKLLDFYLESELKDQNGNPTGFLLRRRHHWRGMEPASTDELCGVLLGIFFYIKAANHQNDAHESSRATELLRRIALYLKNNDYIYKPPDFSDIHYDPGKANSWIYQFPFSRIFKEHLGDSFRSDEVIPEGWQGNWGDVAYIFASAINLDVNYTQQDLFRDVLSKYPSLYYGLGGENFFNMTMTCYALLMVLLPDVVSDDVKGDIGNNGESFIFDLSRWPESDEHDNAFFAVVAKLCKQHKKEGFFTKVGGAIKGAFKALPLVGGAVSIVDAISDGICRGVMWLEDACSEYAQGEWECIDGYEKNVKECKERKQKSYERCDEWKDEGHSECSNWKKECSWKKPWNCVVSWVCTGWYWVANWVCKAYVTVVEWVCIAWHWVKKWVCTGWKWVVKIGCTLLTWPTKKATCRRGSSWVDQFETVIENLTHPRDRWFHDLPIGEPKDANEAPFDRVNPFKHRNLEGRLFLGGDTFTWVHSDDRGHTYTYASPWDVGKSTREVGPSYDTKKHPRWPCGESLDLLYTSEDYHIDPNKGLRLESSGLGLLFPRMLLAYLDMAPIPQLENKDKFDILPVRGPSPIIGNMCEESELIEGLSHDWLLFSSTFRG